MTSGASSFNRTFCRASLILLQAVVLIPAALANPQDGRVAAGSASIDRTSASRLDVNQHSDRTVIDWRSFNIRTHEHTNFRQPSASAIALNRVQGSGSSLIDGRLTANGQVFLVNQNGVLFGKNARVDVAGLAATTADINNEDFMNGHYRFDKPSANPDAQVVNKGQIRVQDGGAVVLAAPRVSNEGLITARLGNVALAGAKTYTLDFHGDGLLQFDAGSEVTENPSASQSESDALVSNSGTIVADGGIVAMSARAADGVVDRVINMDGVVQARAVALEDGKIVLSGGDEGIVAVSGKLDASGLETDQKGGTVKVLGEKVGLFEGAKIDASGDAGGGDVLIGGNYQGKGPEPNAKQTFVDEGATIKADAITRGDGGKIIVWADEAARIHGALSARGGAVSGNGGFIETSSKKALTVSSTPDASAPNGSGGTWLIDPTNITICAGAGCDIIIEIVFQAPRISNATINAVLNGGTDVDIVTSSAGSEQGNITQEPGAVISKTAGADATLTLQAHNNINLNDSITSTSNSLNLVLNADSDNSGAGAVSSTGNISTNGGDVTITSSNIISLNSLSSGAGDITLTANEINTFGGITGSGDLIFQPFTASLDIVVGGLSDTGIPALELGSAGFATTDGFSSITVGRSDGTGTITVDPAGVSFNDDVTLQSPGGAIVLNGTITTTGSDFSVLGSTLLESDSSVSTGGGGITFDGLIDSAVDEGDPAALTLDAVAGAIALLGNVGSRSPLARLTATGGSIGLQDVTTTGDQSYTGAVTFNSGYITNGGDFLVNGNTLLRSDSSVSSGGGGITFNGLIDSAVDEGDPAALVLNAVDGAIALLGNVGSRSRLGGLTATGGSIGLQDVTTSGLQRYSGAVTLNSAYVTGGGAFVVDGDAFLGSPTTVRTAGGQIEFGGRLNGSNPLSLFANTGDILFRRDVGTLAPLGTVSIGSADDILIGGRFFGGNSQFTYNGVVTSPPDALDLTRLFLDPTAEGATLFGSVRGVSGDDAALAVEGPRNDPRFTINNCVIGVACGQPVVPEPVVPEPLQLPAEPIPPVGLFGSTPSPTEGRTLWAIYKRRAPEDPTGETQVSYDNIPPVYKRRPPSEDPTEPQYSNFGNEELWD